MMARYALLYPSLNETVAAHYTSDMREFTKFDYIPAALNDATMQMVAQGWQVVSSAGPQSILLKREAE